MDSSALNYRMVAQPMSTRLEIMLGYIIKSVHIRSVEDFNSAKSAAFPVIFHESFVSSSPLHNLICLRRRYVRRCQRNPIPTFTCYIFDNYRLGTTSIDLGANGNPGLPYASASKVVAIGRGMLAQSS